MVFFMKKNKKTSRKSLERELDNLWRSVVYKNADYECEYCGSTGRLNAHHIFSRSNKNVRHDPDNGVCLCVSHHVFGKLSFHKSPLEMLEWIREIRGEDWYNQLRSRAMERKKLSIVDLENIKEKLLKFICQ